jgi:lysophospholipase L1-like esterase
MRILFRLAAVALSMLFAVVLSEAALRFMNMGFGNSPMEPDPVLHHVHPRNYSFIQQHPSGELGGFEIEYDAEGRVYRGRAAGHTEPANAPCRVAFMGDSFTEAGQVPYPESFAGRIEAAAPECAVRNYGVRSYSPAIYLVQWSTVIAPWQPTHVFVLVFGGDLREDVAYLSNATLDARGLPTAIHGPDDGWLVSQLRRSYVARFVRMVTQRFEWWRTHRHDEQWTVGGVVEERPEWTGPTPRLIEELHRRVTAAGAQLTLMVVPSRYRFMGDGKIAIAGDLHDTVSAWAKQRHIGFLDLNTPFERESKRTALFFRQDIHFTSDGHKVVADAITRQYPELTGR